MSFQSMNGVNAARRGGLAGTSRQAPATFQQPYTQSPQVPQMAPTEAPYPTNAPTQPGTKYAGSAYTIGAGMLNTGRARQAQVSDQVTAAQNGTMAGQQMPSAVGPQQMPAFDPNDPNNAALAGYMNGGNG